MEYVIVRFSDTRKVFIDDKEGGITNSILRVDTGSYTFDLGEPHNYMPESVTVRVKDTVSNKPMEVTFEKI